jgi:glycerophosphoryl diester phosphodiesterase
MPNPNPDRPRFPDLPRWIGHRGLAAFAPENTLAGIRMAAERGLRWIEIDAKLTSDGTLILMHDDRLDRTTNGKGTVATTSFDAIRRLDAGSWFNPKFAGERIPTLVEAIDLMMALDLGCNVEIKPCPGREMETAGAVADTLLRHWPASYGRLVVSSFEQAAMARFRDLAPDLPRGHLVWDRTATMLADADELGCGSIHCAHQHLEESAARAVKRANFRLVVYTVNDPVQARRLIEWGIDTIISDTDGVAGDTASPAGPAQGRSPTGSRNSSGQSASPARFAGAVAPAPAEDDRGSPPAA